ncbi:MAG: DUF1292 domain-containing protein [Lachnospiraceae bacterium]|nr:DUF1292 domain-containing protein [Lachnospiraceae bacterium]MBQ9390920.1 DUF1292 domain-containing protein [Lachnospiraceae bacterium]
MKNNNIPETDDDVMVTIELDGEDLDCEILTIFDIDNQDYIVLMPVDENGEPLDDTLVYIYRYFENDGDYAIDNIQSDEEYERVNKRFNELLEENE